MDAKEENKISVDVLKHVESLSSKVNQMMALRTKAVWSRYPITFGLLILIGSTSLLEGLKGLMKDFGLLDLSPWYLFLAGLLILTVTGTLYKKLEK